MVQFETADSFKILQITKTLRHWRNHKMKPQKGRVLKLNTECKMWNDNFAYDISLNSDRTSRRSQLANNSIITWLETTSVDEMMWTLKRRRYRVVPIAVTNINRVKGKPEKSFRASTELEPVVYALLSTAMLCQLGYDH